MKGLIKLNEQYVNKRLTLHIPKKYFKDEVGIDVDQFLQDNNAKSVYFITEDNKHLCPSNCVLDYAPSGFDAWNLVITDWDGRTDTFPSVQVQ